MKEKEDLSFYCDEPISPFGVWILGEVRHYFGDDLSRRYDMSTNTNQVPKVQIRSCTSKKKN